MELINPNDLYAYSYASDTGKKVIDVSSVDVLPRIEANPINYAEWIGVDFEGYSSNRPVYCEFECSNCHGTIVGSNCIHYYKFCPYCGSTMKNYISYGGLK